MAPIDGSCTEPTLRSLGDAHWLRTALRKAISHGVSGMVDEYRRHYGPWGFDLDEIRQKAALPVGELSVVASTGHLCVRTGLFR
jgi:hypothetical protein